MAVRQSTRAKARGRALKSSVHPATSAARAQDNFTEILGEFSQSICFLEVICQALEESTAASAVAGHYAVSLRHTLALVNVVYEKLDLAIVAAFPENEPNVAPIT